MKRYARALKEKPALSMEDADKMLDALGWSLDRQSPLEISDGKGNSATGFAACIVIAEFKNNFIDHYRGK